jgi:hypothetical protein
MNYDGGGGSTREGVRDAQEEEEGEEEKTLRDIRQ